MHDGAVDRRRPAAAQAGCGAFRARAAYMLWLLPLLRLVLPPLPGGERIVTVAAVDPGVVDLPLAPAPAAATAAPWTAAADAILPLWPLLWAAGFLSVIGYTMWHHLAWHRALVREATDLAPVEGVRLVMTAAVDGPVATGLVRPLIAVPTDFFARYNQNERALAIEHELAHHRARDLWPMWRPCWCSQRNGSTRLPGQPSARFALTRRPRATRACWAALPHRTAPSRRTAMPARLPKAWSDPGWCLPRP
ncbi:MAG: hypothetical protein HC788_14405 [Sphingopyxis sp.]|nr:hypothetical protein [Sphingopyxis sp.]